MTRCIMVITIMMCAGFLLLFFGVNVGTPLALMLLVVAVVLDMATTFLAMKRGGKEGNPIVAFLFKTIGMYWSFALVAVAWSLFIYFRWLPSDEGTQTATALIYWVVPVNNINILVTMRKSSKSRRTA